MAEKACHVVVSTVQVGLIQALGRMTEILSSVRSFWPFYSIAWLFFPTLVLAVRVFGISLQDWWVSLLLFSLGAGLVPWVPWFKGKVSYSVNSFWAIVVPFIGLLVAGTVASAAA